MLIISQNRESVVNMSALFEISTGKVMKRRGKKPAEAVPAIFVSNGMRECLLGKYEAETRCKEILTDICEQYHKFLNFPGSEGNTVFMMPEQ